MRCFVANGIVSALWSPSSGNHSSSGDFYLDTDDYTVVYPAFNNPLLDAQAAVEGLSRLGFVKQYLRFQSLFDATTTTYKGSLYDSTIPSWTQLYEEFLNQSNPSITHVLCVSGLVSNGLQYPMFETIAHWLSVP
jgi:hypothetical protein